MTLVQSKTLLMYPVTFVSIASSKSKTVEPQLSPSEQLRKDMLTHRFANTAPDPVMNVQIGIKLTSVRYDAFEAKMYTEVAAVAVRSILFLLKHFMTRVHERSLLVKRQAQNPG